MKKVFGAIMVLAVLALGVAIVVGGRGTTPNGPLPTVLAVASPADSFVVHDAPAAAPTVIVPDPAATPSSGPSALDAAIERLRANKDPAAVADDPAAVVPTPVPTPVVPVVVAPIAPIAPPPPTWTATTAQGARWRSGRENLLIDMGGGRQATVHVDPAFQSLSPDAANSRIDFLKQTILENFPGSVTQFRFNRDGSVSALR